MAEQVSIVTSPHARREGEGWDIDPGAQELSVVDPSSTQTKKVQFDLRPGERREIDVDFAPPNATCAKGTASTPAAGEGATRRIPLLSVGLGSLGLGFVVLGGTLGIIGAGKRSDLDACKPNCSEDRIDAVRPYLIIGDTVAVVGLVAIGAAIAVYFMGPNAPVKASASGVAVTF
jgi:hypothetical protein